MPTALNATKLLGAVQFGECFTFFFRHAHAVLGRGERSLAHIGHIGFDSLKHDRMQICEALDEA